MRNSMYVAIAALAGLLFGYNSGDISAALLFLRDGFHLSSLMSGVVTSIALAGAAGGAAFAGPLADRFGRRPLLLVTGLVFALGALVSTAAPSLAMLLCGRLVVGIGIGLASMLSPLYLSEIAPANERGRFVSYNQLAMTAGILIANLVGYAFSAAGAWRWMLGLGGLPGLFLALGGIALPETPRWLFGHGHSDQARAALTRLRGAGVDFEAEIGQLRADLKKPAQTLLRSRLAHKAARMPLLVGIGLAVLQQATGINTVIYFAPTIFRTAGLSSASAAILATAGIGVVNVAMTTVALRLVDRTGRRLLLLSGLLGMGLSLCLLALGLLLGAGKVLSAITTASLAAYVGCFAIGLGPVFWLLISEIFPLAIRGRAMSIATTANWLANLVVALTFLNLVNVLGSPAVFLIYAALSFGAVWFVRALVPETKGLSLEEVENFWTMQAAP